jgi:hypothetical protein
LDLKQFLHLIPTVTIESNVVVISIVLQAGGNLTYDAPCFAIHLLFIQLMAANGSQLDIFFLC